MLRFNGITPVAVTPFNQDESIDDSALRRQVDFAVEAGAAAICGPGFAAEFYKLSDAERYHFLEVLVDCTKRRVPVIAATSSGSTFSTIEFSRWAQSIGADCLMVTPPSTARLPAGEIIRYYSRLCDAVQIPVMLQDADFTGAGFAAAVFVELARRHPNFLFAKLEVQLPGQKCAEIIEQTSGQVQIIYGLGGIAMMDGLAHGASAMMPGAACLEAYVRIYDLYMRGDHQEAKGVFNRLVPYLTFAMQHLELAIGIEKLVFAKRGILRDARLREPTLHLDQKYELQMSELADDVIKLSSECSLSRSVSK
jgi:dihydrodipicolinate synthase/N-acetylneuraminate lyase